VSHSKLRARLNDYVDRELPGTQRAEVSAHLKQCEECALEVRELDRAVALLRRLPEPELPPAFADTVVERIRAGESEPRWLRGLRGVLQPALTVAATAAVAGLAVFTVVRGDVPGGATAPAHDVAQVAQVEQVEMDAPTTTLAAVAPAATGSAEKVGVASREDGLRKVVRQMRRHRRALELTRQGHGDVVARSLRGAGHPHSATLASHFSDPDPFGLIVPAQAVGSPTARR